MFALNLLIFLLFLSAGRDVILKLFDDKFLMGDDSFNDITNRNNPDKFILIEHWKMANTFIGHKRHALFNRLIDTYKEYPRCHDLFYRGAHRGFALQDDLPGIIAF